MLEVEALACPTNLDVHAALDPFQRDFFAGVTESKVDFAEAADPDSPLDGKPTERPRAGCVGKAHDPVSWSPILVRCGAREIVSVGMVGCRFHVFAGFL